MKKVQADVSVQDQSGNKSKPLLQAVFLTSTKIYRKYMFMYGILSVLYVLEYFEFNENYEECKKIIDAIKDQEKILDTTLFSTVTADTIKEVVDSYKKFNLTGKNAIENSKYYATLILKEIKCNFV
jgi:hypothetical protein